MNKTFIFTALSFLSCRVEGALRFERGGINKSPQTTLLVLEVDLFVLYGNFRAPDVDFKSD